MDHTSSTATPGMDISPIILRELDVGRSIRTATNSHDSSPSLLFFSFCSDPPNHHTFNDVGVVDDAVGAVGISCEVDNEFDFDFDKILLVVGGDLRVVKEGLVNPNENKRSGLERSITSSSIGNFCSDEVFDILTGVEEVLSRRCCRRCLDIIDIDELVVPVIQVVLLVLFAIVYCLYCIYMR